MITLKNILCALAGTVGAAVVQLFGGWSAALTTLLIFMALDYITGLIVAGVFKASGKSESGGLESVAGWKGLFRKGVTLAIVIVAHRLDLLMSTNCIEEGVIIAFCANECISLTENAGLMGIPIPKGIAQAIDILRGEE